MHIVAVSRSPKHGFSKVPQSSITLLEGIGVDGDAHSGATTQHLYLKRKEPTKPNLTQVHLFPSEQLAELAAKGFPISAGTLGENILTTGIDLLALPTKTRIHLGSEAVIEVTGVRTPCSQIDHFQNGLQQHLWGPRGADNKATRRAGIMAIVLHGGTIRPDDPMRIELPAEPHIPLGPV